MTILQEILDLAKPGGSEGEAKLVQAFRELSLGDAQAIARELLELNPLHANTEDILHRFAAFIPGSLDGLHDTLIEREIYCPSILFLGASATARDSLIGLIGQENAWPNGILKALAWIGDEVVIQQFLQWKENPPDWQAGLYVGPESYALEAGWTIGPDGARHNLYQSMCIPLVPVTADTENVCVDTVLDKEREDECPWCGLKLHDLLDLDISSPALAFLGISGSRLRIAYCIRCSCYGIVYSNVDFEGGSVWYAENERPPFNGYDDEYSVAALPATLGPPRRSPFEAHPSLLSHGGSQLGGFPSWEDDATFPKCPKCAEFMQFIGQVAGSDTVEYGEGYTYAFLCKGCGIAATVYQQT